jgi:hypothetical protein
VECLGTNVIRELERVARRTGMRGSRGLILAGGLPAISDEEVLRFISEDLRPGSTQAMADELKKARFPRYDRRWDTGQIDRLEYFSKMYKLLLDHIDNFDKRISILTYSEMGEHYLPPVYAKAKNNGMGLVQIFIGNFTRRFGKEFIKGDE